MSCEAQCGVSFAVDNEVSFNRKIVELDTSVPLVHSVPLQLQLTPTAETNTPLKPCLSVGKPKAAERKHVAFGSPDAVEFNSLSPVASMTPMSHQLSSQLFPMHAMHLEQVNEHAENDEITSLNSSLLEMADGMTDENGHCFANEIYA